MAKPPSTNDTTKTHFLEAKSLFITPKGRGQFVALDKKIKNKDSTREGDEGAYCLSLLFPPSVDLGPLREAAEEAGKAQFGATFSFGFSDKTPYGDPKKHKEKKSPFLDPVAKGIEIKDEDDNEIDLAGWTLIRFNTYKGQPIVRDGTKPDNARIDTDEISVECYPGRWFRVMTRAKGYDIGGGKGVKFYLEGVQALAHDHKTSSFGIGDDGEDFGVPDTSDDDDGI